MRLRLGPLGAPSAIVLAWVAMRMAVLLPVPEETATRQASPRRAGSIAAKTAGDPAFQVAIQPAQNAHSPLSRTEAITARLRLIASTSIAKPVPTRTSGSPVQVVAGVGASSTPFIGRSGTVAGYTPPARPMRRALTGSGWALVNGTGGAVGVPSLGGSQAGLRLFLQGQSAPLALTARVSRALGAVRDTEASAGYALRAKGLGLLVERRERLDVRSGAFVVTGYGGVYDAKLPAGLRFDGFAQGGIAGLRQRRWFADGQARLTERAALSSRLSLGAGGGAWASAQQGARRVEAGPLVEARLRTGDIGLRVAGEYRFRVTGDATPRSGPALTVGVDF